MTGRSGRTFCKQVRGASLGTGGQKGFLPDAVPSPGTPNHPHSHTAPHPHPSLQAQAGADGTRANSFHISFA